MLTGLVLGLALGVSLVALRLRVVSRRARHQEERAIQLEQEKEMVVRFMREMVEALGEGVERTGLFQRIVRAALRCTGALSACIYESLPDGSLRSVAAEGLFPPQRPIPDASRGKLATRAKFIEQVLRSETLRPGEGVVGDVASRRVGELITDAAGDPRIVDHGDPVLAVRSLIAMPIEFRGSLVGVLAVTNPIGGGAFTETDFSLVRSLAEQAGLALHNNEFLNLQVEKRQMDVDLSIAQEIQQLLVPQTLPSAPGLDIDARYIPARQVGGDLVDAVEMPDGRLAIVVADVAGKSVGASILMAICRTRVRHALAHATSPAEVLRRVNRDMTGEFRPGMFVTVVVAVFDATTGEVTLARAGHEPPLLARREDGRSLMTCRFVELDGMGLGIAEPELFDEVISDGRFRMEPGDMLVLYTDGLTEAPNDEGKEFSTSRLLDAVRVLGDRSAREACEGILETVRRFAGSSKPGDDLSFVLIKRV
jgi:sigma-B regulation protein RsbU (phosphoserine phosphatase)